MAFEFTGIHAYQQALQNGSVGCRQAVEHYLQAIDRNRHLNALVAVFEAEALERADELDARLQQGVGKRALEGIPYCHPCFEE